MSEFPLISQANKFRHIIRAHNTNQESSLLNSLCNLLRIQIKCKPSSSSRSYKCSKLWLWWPHKAVDKEETTLSRWRCFNKCNKWSQWCKIWWISLNLNRLKEHLKRLSKSPKKSSLTQVTICFQICSKVQLQVTNLTSIRIIIIKWQWMAVLFSVSRFNNRLHLQRLEINRPLIHRVIQTTPLICSTE